MKIQLYDRAVAEPGTAGGVPRQGAGTAELGQATAFNTLGRAMGELAARAQEAQRTADVALRGMAFKQEYGNWWVQRSADPSGYATLASDSDAMLTKLGEKYLKGVDDPLSEAALTKDIYGFAGTQAIESRKLQIAQQIDWSRSSLDKFMFDGRKMVASSNNPQEAMQTRDSVINYIRASAAAGVISPLDAEKKLHSFIDGIAEDQLNYRVFNEPDAVLRELYSGNSEDGSPSPYAGMGEDTRQRLIINAEKRSEAMRQDALADARRNDAIEDRQRREIQDQNFGVAYGAVQRLEFSQNDIRDLLYERAIRGEQYRQLSDALAVYEEKGGMGNTEAKSRLLDRAYQGRITAGEVLNSMRGPGGLNNEQGKEILDVLNRGAAVTTTADYRSAADWLDGQFGVLGYGESSLSPKMVALAKEARRELYEGMVAHPERKPITLARDIFKLLSDGKSPMNPPSRFPDKASVMREFRNNPHFTEEEANTELYKLEQAEQ
jgi:hypothetical protein